MVGVNHDTNIWVASVESSEPKENESEKDNFSAAADDVDNIVPLFFCLRMHKYIMLTIVKKLHRKLA